jgi:hypothetical protein
MRAHGLLAIALCVVAVWVRVDALQKPLPPARAGTENERVAAALATGQGWSDAFDAGTGPTAHTAPLYPLILSGIYRLCGDYETATGRAAQRCLSITLSILVLLALPVLAGKLGLSVTAGWIAAFVGAVWPGNLRVELTGRHETVLATLALLGLIWCLADLRQRDWSGRLAVIRTGFLLGITALVCPNLLLVPLLLFAVELGVRPTAWRQMVVCGAILVAITLLFVSPWMARNYQVLGGFVPLRSNFGLELAVGNRPGADGLTYTPGMEQMHPYTSSAERARLIELGELAYMREKQRQALSWIRAHPGRFAWLMMQRARYFWLTPDETWYPIRINTLAFRIPVYALIGLAASIELLRLLRRNPRAGRLLLCATLAVGLPYLVTHVELRYRLPITGLFNLLGVNLAIALVLGVVRLSSQTGRTAEWARPPAGLRPVEPAA